MDANLLWPQYATPRDLADIEAIPLLQSGLLASTTAPAPKSVTIVDALPVTAVGKPDKLPLRADAARHAVQVALSGFRGVHVVDATVDDGSVVVSVTLDPFADHAAVRAELDRYTVTSRITKRS